MTRAVILSTLLHAGGVHLFGWVGWAVLLGATVPAAVMIAKADLRGRA